MLRFLFVLTITIFSFAQCKTTKKPDKEVPTEQISPKQEEPADTVVEKKPFQRPEGKKYTKAGKNQPSNSVYEFFTTDYWLPQFAISSLDPKVHLRFQDMWLKFDRNEHFIGGINNNQNIVGSWKYDNKTNMLYILSNNKDIEGKWQVNRAGFSMVWLAREGQKMQDIQIKLVNSTYKPGEE